MIDNLSLEEKEVIMLALGIFSENKIENEKIWYENSYKLKFHSNAKEMHSITLNLYNNLLKDIKGGK